MRFHNRARPVFRQMKLALQLGYLMRKAYERSASAVRLTGASRKEGLVPPYMIRKTGEYGLAVVTSVGQQQRRFHLVRLAASLGEIKGHLSARLDRVSQTQS